MALLKDVQQTQQELEMTLSKRMADFEAQLKATSAPPSSLEKLSQDFHNFKDLVWPILGCLRKQIVECQKSLDNIEMRHRRKVILITGVAEKPEEDINRMVIELLHNKLSLQDISSSDFKVCHRLGSRSEARARPVLLHFSDIKLKSLVWRKKTLLKGSSIVISEFLTKPRQSVFTKARIHFGMRSCWTLDGVISVKTPSSERVKLTTMDELDILMARFPKASVSESDQAASQSGAEAAVPAIAKKIITRKQTAFLTSKK